MAPVTRYSSSVKKNGIGGGIDCSIGRVLEAGIDIDDGSIDSTSQTQGDMAYSLQGFNIHLNRNNLSIIAKLYGTGSTAFGYYLGVDYYLNHGKSSPFIGIDLATYKPEDERWRDNFSYIGVIGYSSARNSHTSISYMLRTGISRINVEGSEYKIPEIGIGINIYTWDKYIELCPEIFLNISHLPSGQWAAAIYPGLKFDLTF